MSRAQNLCRLCEFPSGDSGVPVDALDADKLAKWWKQNLGTEFLTDVEEAHRLFICQFCIWEARVVDDFSGNTACDWWSGHDEDHFYQEYFYKKQLIRPCKVVLKTKISSDCDEYLLGTTLLASEICSQDKLELQSQQVKKNSNQYSGIKVFPCTMCKKIYNSQKNLNEHIKMKHKNAVRCKSNRCATYFLTNFERRQHEKRIHLSEGSGKRLKCIFCRALFLGGVRMLNQHIKNKHKEAFKCDFNNQCPNYFLTEAKKNKHILEVHNIGVQLNSHKCIYCGKMYKCISSLAHHINVYHASIKLKCTFPRCAVYFLNQKESEEHFLKKHQHVQCLENYQCPKCNFRTNTRRSFRNHLLRLHTKEATFKCPLCPKAFFMKYSLNRHLKTFHAELCTCDHCGKTTQKKSMQKHFLGKHASS